MISQFYIEEKHSNYFQFSSNLSGSAQIHVVGSRMYAVPVLHTALDLTVRIWSLDPLRAERNGVDVSMPETSRATIFFAGYSQHIRNALTAWSPIFASIIKKAAVFELPRAADYRSLRQSPQVPCFTCFDINLYQVAGRAYVC